MIAGIFVLFPIIVTVFLLKFAFTTLDDIFGLLFSQIFGRKFFGLGLIVMILITFLLGTVVNYSIVEKIIHWIEKLIRRTPLFGAIYNTSHQVANSFKGARGTGFTTPVTIEYPRKGIWTMGFLTKTIQFDEKGKYGLVYMPSTPIPSTGWVVLVPFKEINFLDLRAEQAMQMIIAAGIASKGKLKILHKKSK